MTELKKGLLALAAMLATPLVVLFFIGSHDRGSDLSPALPECPEGFAASNRWYKGGHPEWMSTGVELYQPDAGPDGCHKLVGRIVAGNNSSILVETLALDGSWVEVSQERSHTQNYYWIRLEDSNKLNQLDPLP